MQEFFPLETLLTTTLTTIKFCQIIFGRQSERSSCLKKIDLESMEQIIDIFFIFNGWKNRILGDISQNNIYFMLKHDSRMFYIDIFTSKGRISAEI